MFTETLLIGENASPQDPFTSRAFYFNVTTAPDVFKEAAESFSLTLQDTDPCVWLGRDVATLTVLENGGRFH